VVAAISRIQVRLIKQFLTAEDAKELAKERRVTVLLCGLCENLCDLCV